MKDGEMYVEFYCAQFITGEEAVTLRQKREVMGFVLFKLPLLAQPGLISSKGMKWRYRQQNRLQGDG